MIIDFRGRISKKIIAVMAALLVLFSFIASNFAETVSAASEPENRVILSEYSFVVNDLESGQTLLQSKSGLQFECPQLITTLIGYFSLIRLQSSDKITPKITSLSQDGNYQLKAGHSYSVRELINVSVVAGADNAANELAEKMEFGDTATFLNNFAEDHGLLNTYFVTGNAFTTMADLSKALIFMLENPDFKSLFCSAYVSGPDGDIITNTNQLVFENTEDTIGGNFFGQTLSFVRYSDDSRLIYVMCGVTEGSYLDVEQYLINTIENKFEKKPLVSQGDIVTSVKINEKGTRKIHYVAGGDLKIYMPKDGASVISATTFSFKEGRSEEDLQLPINKGEMTGSVSYTLSDGIVLTIPMYAMSDVHFTNSHIDSLRLSIINYSEIYIIVLALLILLIIIAAYKIWESRA